MKDYWPQIESKKINKKKIIISILVSIIVIITTTITIIYYNNKDVREWIDKNILKKEVIQNNVTTIELKDVENSRIHAFNKYIGVLSRNKFVLYGSTGNEEKSLDIQISNPIFNSTNRFLAIAENRGKKIYLLTDRNITWETEIERKYITSACE